MTLIRAKYENKIFFGKYCLKFAILENNQYVISERDIALFIGGRGGKRWTSLGAKNLQKHINSELKTKIQQKIAYLKKQKNTIMYGYDVSTVIKICQVWFRVYGAGELLASQKSTYEKAKCFYNSVAEIGIVALLSSTKNK